MFFEIFCKMLHECGLDWQDFVFIFNSNQIVVGSVDNNVIACLLQCLKERTTQFLKLLNQKPKNPSFRRESQLFNVELPCCGLFVRKVDVGNHLALCKCQSKQLSFEDLQLAHATRIAKITDCIANRQQKMICVKPIIDACATLVAYVEESDLFCEWSSAPNLELVCKKKHQEPPKINAQHLHQLKGKMKTKQAKITSFLSFCKQLQETYTTLRAQLEYELYAAKLRYQLTLSGCQTMRCTEDTTLIAVDPSLGFAPNEENDWLHLLSINSYKVTVPHECWLDVESNNDHRVHHYQITHLEWNVTFRIEIFIARSGAILVDTKVNNSVFRTWTEAAFCALEEKTRETVVLNVPVGQDCCGIIFDFIHFDFVAVADFIVSFLVKFTIK